jgi:hypothetical protein
MQVGGSAVGRVTGSMSWPAGAAELRRRGDGASVFSTYYWEGDVRIREVEVGVVVTDALT